MMLWEMRMIPSNNISKASISLFNSIYEIQYALKQLLFTNRCLLKNGIHFLVLWWFFRF